MRRKVKRYLMLARRIDRLLLYAKQQERCYYCGCQMTVDRRKRNAPNYATFDHVVARKHRSGITDVVLACRACNELKGTMDAKQFKRMVDSVPREELVRTIRRFWYERRRRRSAG